MLTFVTKSNTRIFLGQSVRVCQNPVGEKMFLIRMPWFAHPTPTMTDALKTYIALHWDWLLEEQSRG